MANNDDAKLAMNHIKSACGMRFILKGIVIVSIFSLAIAETAEHTSSKHKTWFWDEFSLEKGEFSIKSLIIDSSMFNVSILHSRFIFIV